MELSSVVAVVRNFQPPIPVAVTKVITMTVLIMRGSAAVAVSRVTTWGRTSITSIIAESRADCLKSPSGTNYLRRELIMMHEWITERYKPTESLVYVQRKALNMRRIYR